MGNKEKYYVFGAHSRGWTFYEYMKMIRPQCEMMGFIYDNDEVNPSKIDGFPIVKVSYPIECDDSDANARKFVEYDVETTRLDFSAKVFIATRGNYHSEVRERLSGLGFKDIEYVTPEGFRIDGRKANEVCCFIFSSSYRFPLGFVKLRFALVL